jgi:hypothetical protein
MIIKQISKYGFNDCEIIRRGSEDFCIYVKHKETICRIGTAKETRDGRFCIDRLDYQILNELNGVKPNEKCNKNRRIYGQRKTNV